MARMKGKSKDVVPATPTEPEPEEHVEVSDAEEHDEENDHTAALLTGFESSGDERDGDDEGYTAGQTVPKIPEKPKGKSKGKAVSKTSDDKSQGPGVVYVGYIMPRNRLFCKIANACQTYPSWLL